MLLIRRCRHAVTRTVHCRPCAGPTFHSCPSRDRRCPVAWQQYWQQPRRNGFDTRPSAFRPDISRVGADRGSVPALPLIAVAYCWSLLLLSPLLSAQPRSCGGRPTRTASQGLNRLGRRPPPAKLTPLDSVGPCRRAVASFQLLACGSRRDCVRRVCMPCSGFLRSACPGSTKDCPGLGEPTSSIHVIWRCGEACSRFTVRRSG
jgi:hypothetical protein